METEFSHINNTQFIHSPNRTHLGQIEQKNPQRAESCYTKIGKFPVRNLSLKLSRQNINYIALFTVNND